MHGLIHLLQRALRIARPHRLRAFRLWPCFLGPGLLACALPSLAAVPSSTSSGLPAASQQAQREATAAHLHELEVKVWTCADPLLGQVEKEVITHLQEQTHSAFGHYLLAHLYLRMFAHDPQRVDLLHKATELAEQSIYLQPQEEYGYVALAEIMDLIGQAEAGLKLLDKAAQLKQQALSSWRQSFTRARLSVKPENSQVVLALLEQSLQSQDSPRSIMVPYIITLIQANYSKEESYEELLRWDQRFPDVLFKQMMAINLSERQLYQEAHRSYESILQQHPDFWEARLNQAVLLYRHLNRSSEAAAAFHLSLQDQRLDQEARAILYSHLAALALKQGDKQAAAQQFIKAIHLSAKPMPVIAFLADAYQAEKYFNELSQLLGEIEVEAPGHAELHALHGQILADRLQDYEGAIDALTDALILEPERSEFYHALGLAFYQAQHLPESLQTFEGALLLNPNDAAAHYNKACVLARLKQAEKAITALGQALALDPQLRQQAAQDQDFANLVALPDFQDLLAEPGFPASPQAHPKQAVHP